MVTWGRLKLYQVIFVCQDYQILPQGIIWNSRSHAYSVIKKIKG